MYLFYTKFFLTTISVAVLMQSTICTAETEDYGMVVPAGAKAGDLELSPCNIFLEGDDQNYAGDCGTLIVPENRNASSSRLIALPVRRIRSLAENALEPIFWFQGGPGSPNSIFYPTDGILERHDFVMVGYRGIDGQVFLECTEIGDAIRNTDGGYLDDDALTAYGRAAEDCSDRIKADGIDLDGYSINQTIDDMEAARLAMGYAKINLFGNSYGTRVEMLYQWRYPDSINRAVLVAVNPPGHFIWDPVHTQKQLVQYAKLCARDPYCSNRTTDLITTMREVSVNMPEDWLGISIDPASVKLITFISFMESMQLLDEPVPLNGPAAIDMWLDAAEGDASGMALVSLLTPLVLPSIGERGHFLAMGGSVMDYIDPDRDYRAELTGSATVLGAPFSLFVWCMTNGWDYSEDLGFNEVQQSDIETLLVTGNLDFSTPMEFARDELLPYLPNGHQVILKNFGHTETFWNSQPEARTKLLNRFFDSGMVDDSLYQHQELVFEVDKSWGELVRILIVLIVIVLGVVVLAVGLLIRKLK
jgi:pimeloyl-ACP methyl ester carboxylesterase